MNVAENEGDSDSPTSPLRNFSRPMSPGAGPIATTKKYTHKSGPWFTGSATQEQPTTAQGMSSNRSAPSQVNTWNSNEADSVMVYDPNTRSFVQRYKTQPQDASPTSPVFSKPKQVYDPGTRSFVSSQAPAPIQRQDPPPPAPIIKKARPVPAPVNTDLEPPPRNPARLSPTTSSPISPRAAGFLQKQPSVVREDPEAEQEAERSTSTTSRSTEPPQTIASSTAPPKAYQRAAAPHQRSSSLDVPRGAGASGRGRTTSTSPQRSAHFSPSPVTEFERHEPLPRNVSPFKSALKHSPASSVRTASPIALFSPLSKTTSPPSETSEDTQSQDGLGGGKKKKSVRVSFDEQPKEIDPPMTPAPVRNFDEEDDFSKPRPALPSFGSVRKNRVQPDVAEKVTEMPPERHEGSSDRAIGGILRNSLEPLPPEVTSKEGSGYVSDESSDSEVPAVASAATPKPATVGAGRDVGNGGQPMVKDFAPATIVPQETVQTSGAGSLDVPEIALQPPTPGVDEDTKRGLGELEHDDFAPRSKPRNSMENINVPGGWESEFESDDKNIAKQTPLQQASAIADIATPVRKSSAEDSAATQTVTPMPEPEISASPEVLTDIDEDTSDAEFSDAVEDASDLEDHNGGFASLDAIVESPIVTPVVPAASIDTTSKARALDDVPESPSTKQAAKAAERAGAKQSDPAAWNEATAYWSQLSKERRQQIERAHMSDDDEETPRPAKKKVVPVKTTPNTTAAAPKAGILKQTAKPKPVPTSNQQPQAQPSFRKTMRGSQGTSAPDDAVHLRSSMRAATGSMTARPRQQAPQARPQSEYVEPRGTLQKKSMRPQSATGVPASAASGNQGSSYPPLPAKKLPVQGRSDPPQVSTRLQRELTNDSDSESSFKKKRKAGASGMDTAGKYNMRRSMRANSIESQPSVMSAAEQRRPTSPPMSAAARNRAFSLRSLSPTGSFFGRNSRPEPSRGVDAGPRTTLRGAPAARGNSTARTTLRAAPPAPVTPARSAPKSRFKSRFADSDDSDDDRPAGRTFRSRFADSDDSGDEPAPRAADLRPVRGIPRKQGQDDGDSTDLEEEDVVPRLPSQKREKMNSPMEPDPSDVEKAMAAARRNLGISDKPVQTETHEGEALRQGTLRAKAAEKAESTPPATPLDQPELKKRGFMSSILRRSRASSSSVQRLSQTSTPPLPSLAPATPPSQPTAPAVQPTHPVQPTPSVQPTPPATPSPGKLVRRSSAQPQLQRGNSTFSTATAPVTSSPLAARTKTPDSTNWPLPPPIPANEDDGVARAAAADIKRPNTSDGVSQEAISLARSMRPDLAPRSKSGQPLGTSSFRPESFRGESFRAESSHPRVRIQAGEEGSEPGERERKPGDIYSRRTGKKKKFGMLRRAFGIND